MDYYFIGQSLATPSVVADSSQDIPSFEEAFSTDSLKRFYKQQTSQTLFTAKHRSQPMDEEFNIQSFGSISPATTVQSQGFSDLYQQYEDMRDDRNPAARRMLSSGLKLHMSPEKGNHANIPQNMYGTSPQRSRNDVARAQVCQIQQGNSEPQQMISSLFQHIQQYYTASGFQPQQSDPVNQVVDEISNTRKESDISWKTRNAQVIYDEETRNTVLRKLIHKQPVFTINGRRPVNLHLKKNLRVQPTFNAQFQPQEQAQAKQMIPIQFNTQSLNTPALFLERKDSDVTDAYKKELKTSKVSRKQSEKIEQGEAPEKKPRKERKDKGTKKQKKDKTEEEELHTEQSMIQTNSINMQISRSQSSISNTEAFLSKKIVFGNIMDGMKGFA